MRVFRPAPGVVRYLIVASVVVLLVAWTFSTDGKTSATELGRPASPAAFTPGNIVVYRVGDGTAATSTTAQPAFLDEYTPALTSAGNTVAFPTSASGLNRAFTDTRLTTGSVLSSDDGGLITRSTDACYVVAGGFDAPVGTTNVGKTTAAQRNRVIARVDAAGNVDTTAAFSQAYDQGYIASVASTDGFNFWTTGSVLNSPLAGTPTPITDSSGVRYGISGNPASTLLQEYPNWRQANIFDSQLYASHVSFTVSKIGVGLPTTYPTQTPGPLPGFIPPPPTPFPSSFPDNIVSFSMVDLDGGVTGSDVMYISDYNSNKIFKYSLVGGNWTANGTVSVTNPHAILAVRSGGGSNVDVYFVGNSWSTVQKLTDTSGYNSTITGSVSATISAGANQVFRGIALAPVNSGSCVTATATPTATSTGTATSTPTETSTPTQTATATATGTSTATATVTSTPTATSTGSATSTVTSTATGTVAAISTATATPTGTATGSTATATATTTAPAGLGNLRLITPVRVLDTRTGPGFQPSGAAIVPGPLAPGTTARFKVGGATFGAQTFPADATGLLLNVTVDQTETGGASGGFVTVFPGDQATPPNASTVNPSTAIAANFAAVGLPNGGANAGTVAVYSVGATRHVILDVVGYYSPSNPTGIGNLSFVPPVRVVDTRAGSTVGFNPDGTPISAAKLVPNTSRAFSLAGRSFSTPSGFVGFPGDLTGVIAHVTTVQDAGSGGFVTLLPGDAAGVPNTSTVNPSTAVAFNSWVSAVPTGGAGAGQVRVYSTNALDVVIDVLGYYSPSAPASVGNLTFINPVRVLDTRGTDGGPIGVNANGSAVAAAPFTENETRRYRFAGQAFPGGSLPAGLTGVLANVTIVRPGGPSGGFVTAFPGNLASPPNVSTVNPATGTAASFWANGLPLDGTEAIYSTESLHVIVDVLGYYGPAVSGAPVPAPRR